jgi:sterol desaturase/sphingolipid hydroxylase (fatty acid hydroxylase superfamily)
VSDVLNQLSGVATSKASTVAGAFVLLFLLERAFPVVSWPSGIARLGRNLSLASLNFIASPLIVIPLTMAAATHALDWRPVLWSGWPGLLLDLLLLDMWIYWWHRLNHRLPFLWRFHEVHHLDETLDTTSALRFHFGEVVLSSLVRAGVIVLLAVPLTSVVVFEVLLLLSTLMHHSNLKLPPRFEKLLSFFIVTPSIHWVHHHAIKADTDSNYATVLSIWDRVFGSVSTTQRTVEMKIGVEGRAERKLLGLLIKPFWH